MTYALRTSKGLPQDIDEARAFYETRRVGLGDQLVVEIYEMIDLLLENPFIFQKRYGEYRLATTRRFNYKLIYRIYETYVRIVAVQHPSQHPTFWMRRL